MIRALLLALQLAVVTPDGPLTVRLGDRAVDIPVATRQGVQVVRADVLARALDARLQSEAGGRYTLRIGDVALGFTEQVPFVRRGGEALPLASAPFVADGRLFLPLQVVSEVVPRLVETLAYDAAARELRRVAPGAGAVAAAATATVAPASAARDDGATPVLRVSRPAPAPGRAAPRTVIVDAGHGGPDNGMRGPLRGGPQIREKDITLAVARRYADVLKARGLRVVMTRTTDTLIALADRGRIANRERGDLFVSIHVNAANPRWQNAGGARGYETYFLADAKTEDARRVAEMENASERFESVAETSRGDPLRFIVTDMQQNEHLRESSELAALVQRYLGRVNDGPSRGVKQAGFKVLVTAFMPAVLVELGFGTNATDAAMLHDGAKQQRMAEVLADATEEYLRRLEPKGSALPE